jgi:hypothetical protein
VAPQNRRAKQQYSCNRLKPLVGEGSRVCDWQTDFAGRYRKVRFYMHRSAVRVGLKGLRQVTFAIIDDDNARRTQAQGNLLPFRRAFSSDPTTRLAVSEQLAVSRRSPARALDGRMAPEDLVRRPGAQLGRCALSKNAAQLCALHISLLSAVRLICSHGREHARESGLHRPVAASRRPPNARRPRRRPPRHLCCRWSTRGS